MRSLDGSALDFGVPVFRIGFHCLLLLPANMNEKKTFRHGYT